MVEWKRLNIPAVNPLDNSLVLNKTSVNSVKNTSNHLRNFKPSLVFQIGYTRVGSIYTFISQKRKGNTSDVFERVYRSLRFSDGINRIENFTKTSEDFMIVNVPNSSEGPNWLIGVFGPTHYQGLKFYSILHSIDKRIEYCLNVLPYEGSFFSVDVVSAYN